MMQPDISVILINYNTTGLLKACLKSLYEFSTDVAIETIVIDNNSNENPKDLLQHDYPKVIFIDNPVNSGFSRANNIGINAATGKYLLLLNSDTIFIEDSIRKCIDYYETHEKIGVLGCKLLNEDGSLQYSFHWSAATFKKVIQENALYNAFFKNKTALKQTERIFQQHQQTNEVDWLSGAFLMMDRVTCLGNDFLLDEDFFMYSEDVELCRRINKVGYKVIYFPETSIIHLGGGGTNVPLKRTGQLLLSEWLCILKNNGKIGLIGYLILWRNNHLLDHLIYLKNRLLSRTSFKDKKQLARRRFEIAVFNKYFGTFMFKYSSRLNSNKQFLKYDATKA